MIRFNPLNRGILILTFGGNYNENDGDSFNPLNRGILTLTVEHAVVMEYVTPSFNPLNRGRDSDQLSAISS